ncbi:Vacuolar protein sorting-associated protein 53 [Mycena venus]|uniref:Vacuolar protein sorting-associated protein 53 n=1 Tax=Mycena venus TaxID=2733690 RepID=A0A8H6YM77_9AGAR|nr:Vacuolar protein sorting-associated protein 53 [Mycena venus]
MHHDELPHEVILAIERVLELGPDADPLDALSNDFNPVDILNGFFPDEGSLAHIASVQAHLIESQRELQREIDALQAELKQNQDPTRMHLIQEMISDLFGQMSRIREKATESEAVVRNITKDIQVLDLAKRNLILSMTTLKRLQMLVNALTQLEDFVKEKKYADVAQTLAVRICDNSFVSMLKHFVFRRLSRYPFLSNRTHPSSVFLKFGSRFKNFKAKSGLTLIMILTPCKSFLSLPGLQTAETVCSYLQDPSKPVKPSVIADACSVVDVLGADVRAQMIERYVAIELKEYRRIFRTSDEAGQLDNISRRFAWFRRLLQTHEVEQGRAFPSDWKVGWHLLAKFSEITRDDLAALLSKTGASLTVKTLLDNLQLTAEFESSMVKKWATPFQEMLNITATPHSAPPKTITSAFEPHMGVFVDAQDRALADMLAPHRKGRGANTPRPSLDVEHGGPGDDDNKTIMVLPSSTELFYFYGQSLEQCAKLSTGKPLYNLSTLHKKWLRIYAEDVLIAGLKRQPSLTTDYCQTTALELEEKIRGKVNEEFKEKISLQAERDQFLSVISAAIVVQLRELEAACEPAFTAMSRSSWGTLKQVSGQSAYTVDLVNAVEQVVESVKPLVEQKKYLRNFLDKACSLILAKFTNSLVKSRPLKEIGAEQLLIDLQAVRACLLKMPGESLTTTTYTRGLTKSTTQLETLLKVIVTPVDPPEGFILNYTLLIKDASFSNFQKILDLKGTPKAEQNNLLDSFLTITSTNDDLEGTSFLSSLDMDPAGPTQLSSNLSSPGGSRVSLPLSGGGATSETSIFANLTSPGTSGPSTGASVADGRPGDQRQVFSDFRRFVSFGLRRDTQPPTQ